MFFHDPQIGYITQFQAVISVYRQRFGAETVQDAGIARKRDTFSGKYKFPARAIKTMNMGSRIVRTDIASTVKLIKENPPICVADRE